MANLTVGTFYHGTANTLNVSGFRYACETFLDGLLRCREIRKVQAFALDLDAEKRARFDQRLRTLGGAAERCQLIDLSRVADAQALRDADLDVLHEMEGHPRRALAARAALRRPRVPLSIRLHGNRIGMQALFGFYLPLLLGDLRNGDSIICASVASRTAVVRQLDHLRCGLRESLGVDVPFRGSVDLIPFGIDTDFFAPAARDQARRALDLEPEGQIVLAHGRVNLTNKQDPSPLLIVLRRLLRSPGGRALRLIVSGDHGNPHLDLVEQRARHLGISGAVRVMKDVPREKVPLLYAASNVVVCLSDTLIENFGLTALEAMSCGVPVVAVDWAGYRDTVVDGETGFLVPSLWSAYEPDLDLFDALEAASGPALAGQGIAADCEALEQSLRTLLQEEALAARLGAAGRQRALEHYTVRTMMERHLALWHELIPRAQASHKPDRSAAVPPWSMADAFSDYPSRLLDQEDTVELTDDGRAISKSADVICIPPMAGQPIVEETLSAVLRALLRAASGRTSVAEVVGRACVIGACAPLAARRHLMWLIKQGYVRVFAAGPDAGNQIRS